MVIKRLLLMTSVGEILRTERKRQGREIAEIAANLRIVPAYVSSIERDDFKDLPNTFFYKSFVRQYAETIGLDYQSLRSSVNALVAVDEPPAPPVHIPLARLGGWS